MRYYEIVKTNGVYKTKVMITVPYINYGQCLWSGMLYTDMRVRCVWSSYHDIFLFFMEGDVTCERTQVYVYMHAVYKLFVCI